MSLHHAAQHLAAQGRGPDRTLVHMAPSEVQGLQALAKAHGGSLTVNPETGLAEAGFLSNILPALVGAGLMAATGGAAAGVAPWMIGAGVGGVQTLRTGDLSKGLMAGLGAYGGAGLYGGAEAAGLTGGGEQAAQAAPVAPVENAVGVPNAQPQMIGADIEQLAPQQQGMIGADFEQMPQNMPAQNTMANPIKPVTPMQMGDTIKHGLAALTPATIPEQPPLPGEEKYDGPLSRYSMSENYNPYNPTPPNPYYQAQYRNYRYADGGPIEQMSNANSVGMNTGYPGSDIQQGAYATPWQTPVSRNMVAGSADTGVNPMTGEMSFSGGGGISDLGGYSDGGRMLKGPGDGMSDSIPAKIGGKQPARLADGEFVMPADVVSHLGNGSTEAGARQLYKMMDRIRSARTGKKKQAPEVNPRKVMAA